MILASSLGRNLCVAALALNLTACSLVTPKALTPTQAAELAAADRSAAGAGISPLSGDLRLEEALARALKYNLDLRVKLMEEALALNLLEVTKGDMLPKILGQVGYSVRDSDRISQSRDSTSPEGDLLPSRFISQERSHTLSELGLSWSLLDFGLGYYSSQQQADRVLIAAEKRRKAMHLLMQDVRIAFWRLASAQQLETQVRNAIALAEDALADSRKSENARVASPADSMRYQRQVLENLRVLEAVALELSSAQVDLAALIHAPVGQKIRVVQPTFDGRSPSLLNQTIERLEEVALASNPDLRERHYESRIARLEARKALVRMFPNLSFNYSFNNDTDRYLVNNTWNQAGAQLSYNFMTLLSYGKMKRYTAAGVSLADERRITAHMAVLAQVHLARLGVANAAGQLVRAREIAEVDQRLATLANDQEQATALSKLERVSSQAAAILSQLRHLQALSEAQAAEARMMAVLGIEPQVPSVTDTSLAELTAMLGRPATWSVTAGTNY